jgi:hypothetical protein
MVPVYDGFAIKASPFSPHASSLQKIGFRASFAELAVPPGFGNAPA